MNLEKLAQPAAWMNPEERHTAAALIAAFQRLFTERGVPENPFIALRLQDCLVHYTLCRRLENGLLAGSGDITPAEAAQIGRVRDRLRRALKDLEDTAKKLAPPAESSSKTSRKGVPPETPAVTPLDPQKEVQNPTAPPPVSPTRPTGPAGPTSPIPTTTPAIAIERPTPQPVIHIPRPEPLVFQQRPK